MIAQRHRSSAPLVVVALATMVSTATLAQACSASVTAGCAAGIAGGVILAGVAAGSSDDPAIDTGQAMLGGSIFGLTSGCLAAGVTSAVDNAGRRDHQYDEAPPERDRSPRAASRAAAASGEPVAPQMVSAQADLDGIKLYWLGLPRVDRHKVELRFQRYGSQPVLADCREIEVAIDGTSTRFPLVRSTKLAASMVVETVQIETDIETVKAMRAAARVDFRLCALERRLTLAGARAADDFVARFNALAPVVPPAAPPVPLVPPAAPPVPEAAAGAGTPAPSGPSAATLDSQNAPATSAPAGAK